MKYLDDFKIYLTNVKIYNSEDTDITETVLTDSLYNESIFNESIFNPDKFKSTMGIAASPAADRSEEGSEGEGEDEGEGEGEDEGEGGVSEEEQVHSIQMFAIIQSIGDKIPIFKYITKIINDYITSMKPTKRWIKIEKESKKILSKFTATEINSTAYILRILNMSIISNKELEKSLEFMCTDSSKLTGLWDNDMNYFYLKKLDGKETRFIFGLGPSGSGKTYWAVKIIEIFKKNYPNFPDFFLSIDGGLHRKYSYTYQHIVLTIKNDNAIDGFSNLASKIFSSDKIKKKINNFLTEFKKNLDRDTRADTRADINSSYGIPSIYVPETLGGDIISFKKGPKLVQLYSQLTGDNDWICLYIWQARSTNRGYELSWIETIKRNYGSKKLKDIINVNGLNQYPDIDLRTALDNGTIHITSMSTSKSGSEREKDEGKKFDTKAYYISQRNGILMLQHKENEPGVLLNIHNTGGCKGITCEKKDDPDIFNKNLIIEYKNKYGIYYLDKDNFDKNTIYIQDEKTPEFPLNLFKTFLKSIVQSLRMNLRGSGKKYFNTTYKHYKNNAITFTKKKKQKSKKAKKQKTQKSKKLKKAKKQKSKKLKKAKKN